MPSLIVTMPDGSRTLVRLEKASKVLIGSDPCCTVRLPALAADPIHCEVVYHPSSSHPSSNRPSSSRAAAGEAPTGSEIGSRAGAWKVRDLDSTTGVRVNDARVCEELLADGDVVEVGLARVRLVLGPRALIRDRRAAATDAKLHLPGRAHRRRDGRMQRRTSPAFVACAAGVILLSLLGIVAVRSGSADKRIYSLNEARASSSETRPAAPAAIGAAAGEDADDLAASSHAIDPMVESSTEPQADAPAGSPDAVAIAAAETPAAVRSEDAGSAGASQDDRAPAASAPAAASDDAVAQRAQLAKLERLALRDLSALDFAAAERRLDAARDAGASADDLAALAAECAAARDTWKALLAALDAAVAKKTAFEVPRGAVLIHSGPSEVLRHQAAKSRTFKIGAVDDGLFTAVDPQGNAIGKFRMLSLPDAILLRLLDGGASSSETAVEHRRGLGLLLLHGEGPERARQMLEASAEDEKEREALAARLEEEKTAWPARRASALSIRRGKLEKSAETSAEDWARLAGELAAVLMAAPATGATKKTMQRLREDFIASRAASLPLAALFNAETEKFTDDVASLTYDFSSAQSAALQASDWRAVAADTPAPRIAKRALLLQGEYRLLEGNPFVDRLAVRGKASSLNPQSPNLNIALWTQPADKVTCTDGARTSWFTLLQRQAGEPADYFVFGFGYRTVVCSALDRPVEQVLVAHTRESFDLPALVVLAGARGSVLHKDLGEGLLAEPIAASQARPVELNVDWNAGAATWTVNKRAVPLAAPHCAQRFAKVESRRGSITLFTNGQPVAWSAIEVGGKLDSEWVAARKRAHAARELESEIEIAIAP